MVENLLMKMFFYGKQKELYETEFPNTKNFQPFYEKLKNGVSLVFLNSHVSMNYPRPYLPTLIEVGGMHIKRKIESLPSDVQSFIESSHDGVVYFSLGGNLKPSDMPKEKQQAIISSLSKIKEKIIWKWDDPNVQVDKDKFLIKNWFQQDAILADPNVKIFITHGGLLGGMEAVYYGKPLITVPVFGDQKLNAARSVSMGYGLRVDYSNLTESSLTWALDEMLNNDKYRNKAAELSKLFRNRPQHPVDLAKFYVEYVIENKGAKFLQSQANKLTMIEFFNLDVIAILVTVPALIFLMFFYFIRILMKCSKNQNELKLKKK